MYGRQLFCYFQSMERWLSKDKRNELSRLHQRSLELWQGARIKDILHLDSGWTYEEVAEALLIDDQTVRRRERTYREHGTAALLTRDYQGSDSKLNLSKTACRYAPA